MKIGFDVAQACVPKAGCGWVAECIAREFLRVSPKNEYVWYHQFGRWINPTTDGGPQAAGGVDAPFQGMAAGEALARWNEIRKTGLLPGKPDVVHAHSFNAPRLEGSRLVFTAHDVSFWRHPEFTTEHNRMNCQRGVLEALAHADGFYFTSEHARREFNAFTGGILDETGRPTLVRPLGARQPAPPPGWKKSSEGPWLAVGSLEPRKNLDFLLDAYLRYALESRAPRPLRLVGGTGWMSEELLRRIAAWSGPGAIEYSGYLDDGRLLEEYRSAFALLFPSRHEGFGLPVLEAMQQRTPVICGRVASLPEVGGDAVRYADVSSVEEFADAMLELDNHESRWAALCEAGAKRSLTFTWDRLVLALEEFYRQMLRGPD
jgi:glycosyltransferase involved in cell wall biosynthesis